MLQKKLLDLCKTAVVYGMIASGIAFSSDGNNAELKYHQKLVSQLFIKAKNSHDLLIQDPIQNPYLSYGETMRIVNGLGGEQIVRNYFNLKGGENEDILTSPIVELKHKMFEKAANCKDFKTGGLKYSQLDDIIKKGKVSDNQIEIYLKSEKEKNSKEILKKKIANLSYSTKVFLIADKNKDDMLTCSETVNILDQITDRKSIGIFLKSIKRYSVDSTALSMRQEVFRYFAESSNLTGNLTIENFETMVQSLKISSSSLETALYFASLDDFKPNLSYMAFSKADLNQDTKLDFNEAINALDHLASFYELALYTHNKAGYDMESVKAMGFLELRQAVFKTATKNSNIEGKISGLEFTNLLKDCRVNNQRIKAYLEDQKYNVESPK